jgi:hypothetical protein
MMSRTTSLVLILLVACGSLHAQPLRILFIGNSYTYYNDLPGSLVQLAADAGEQVVTAQSTPPGHTLEQHSMNAVTLDLIREGGWDHVVIQEQSQRPAFPDAQVAAEVLPYAQALSDSVRLYSPCAEIVFYMTWGRSQGDAQNCVAFPPVCTYEGMQHRLRLGYLSMAVENSAWCAPVGMAWRTIRQEHPDIVLYDPDGSHPGLAGSYLAASTIFCTVFRRSADGINFNGALSPSTASILRQVATSTVLDSLDVWNIGVNDPLASLEYQYLGNNSVAFESTTAIAPGQTYWWDLGDGNTSNDATLSHTYAGVGPYTVMHAVTDDCGRSDSTTVLIDLLGTSIHGQEQHRSAYWQQDGYLLRTLAPGMMEGTMRFHASDGRLLAHERVVHGQVGLQHVMGEDVRPVIWHWTGPHGERAAGRLLLWGAPGR